MVRDGGLHVGTQGKACVRCSINVAREWNPEVTGATSLPEPTQIPPSLPAS